MKASLHTYVLRPINRGRVEVVKFEDYETLPVNVYTVEGSHCNCPAHTPWCRHKAMIRRRNAVAISMSMSNSGF